MRIDTAVMAGAQLRGKWQPLCPISSTPLQGGEIETHLRLWLEQEEKARDLPPRLVGAPLNLESADIAELLHRRFDHRGHQNRVEVTADLVDVIRDQLQAAFSVCSGGCRPGRTCAARAGPCRSRRWRLKTPPSPALWLAMSVGVLEHNEAGKIHMSETTGIERLWSFLAGSWTGTGGGEGKKNDVGARGFCENALHLRGWTYSQHFVE